MGGLCDILPISVRRDTCGYRVDSRPENRTLKNFFPNKPKS